MSAAPFVQPTYEYEVQLELRNDNTGGVRVITRRERAYHPMDAWSQAILVVSQDAGSATIRLLRIAPPQVDQHGIESAVESVLRRAMRTAKL